MLSQPLSHQLGVRSLILLVSKHTGHLRSLSCSLALQGEGRDETLDLGRLANGLALLVGEGAGDNVLADVVFLFEVEELTDFVGSLGAETTGYRVVSETGDGVVPDLDNSQV